MFVYREIERLFKKSKSVYNLIAVVGARQAGKTTFLEEQIKKISSSYVLFDDPDARALFEADIKKFEMQYIKGFDVVVLDEVQYCKDAGTKLKYLADTGSKIWMTSSSEVLLGRDILSYLVGRVSIIRLYPFSFTEFLAAKGQKELLPHILERNAWEHMTYGGYPKVVTTEDIEMKKRILSDLYETLILKDVARTFAIADLRTLEDLTRYLSLNIGALLSYESVSKNINISFPTLKKYLDALEKSYVLVRVPPFYANKAKELTKQPKLYFIDTGLRNSVARVFSTEPDGHLFENYVFTELVKLGFSPRYWRTKSKAEVDFVVENSNGILPIEVKLSAEPGRVERSLRSFIRAYKPKTALVVAYKGEAGRMNVDGCEIIFTDILGMRKFLE